MIDQEKLAEVRTRLRGGDTPKDPLSSLTPSELRRLRSEVDKLLPDSGEGLNDLNLENELVQQYRAVKDLQDSVIGDDTVPPNQRAQCANAVASTLQQLVKMQVDLKRGEQMKRMESAFLEAIDGLDEATKCKFFVEYERLATENGAME